MAGLEITNYEYSINAGSTWTAISPPDITSPITISGLTNGTAYTVYLRAVNTLGGGKSSDALSTNTTPRTTPSITSFTVDRVNESRATYNVTLNYGGDSTTVTFQRSTDGSNFTDETPTQSTTSTTADLYYNKTGLTPFTDYWFRIKATNAAGTTYSSAVQIKTWGFKTTVLSTSNSNMTIPTITPRGGSRINPSIHEVIIFGGGGNRGSYGAAGGGAAYKTNSSVEVTDSSGYISWTIGATGGGTTTINGLSGGTYSAAGGSNGSDEFPSGPSDYNGGDYYENMTTGGSGSSGNSNAGGAGLYMAEDKSQDWAYGGGGGAGGAGGPATLTGTGSGESATSGSGGAGYTLYTINGGGGGAGGTYAFASAGSSGSYRTYGGGSDGNTANATGGVVRFKYYGA